MGAYKLIEVVKTSEKEQQSLYDFDDPVSASARMHNDFGVAVKLDTTVSVYCLLIEQATGKTMEKLYWDVNQNDADGTNYVNPSIRERVYTHNDYQDDNVSAYDSSQLAIGNFHTKYVSAINNENCHFALVMRINGAGDVRDFEIYVAEE